MTMIDWGVKVAEMAREHEEYKKKIDRLRRFLHMEVRYWIPADHAHCDSNDCQHAAEERMMLDQLEEVLASTQIDTPRRGMETMNL